MMKKSVLIEANNRTYFPEAAMGVLLMGVVEVAMNLSGRKVGECRKPVQPLKDFELVELKEVLKPLGI